MGSKNVASALQSLIQNDLLRGGESRIALFLVGDGRGGWEPWLQVELAVQLKAAEKSNLAFLYEREINYPALGLKCDLRISPDPAPVGGRAPGKGAPIWIELKTQRSAGYATAVADLGTDIAKFAKNGAKDDVFIAAAVLLANGNTVKEVTALGTAVPHNSTLNMSLLRAGKWSASTDAKNIAVGDVVFLMWINVLN